MREVEIRKVFAELSIHLFTYLLQTPSNGQRW